MRDTKFYTILDAKAATGVGLSINVKDFRHLVVIIGTADNANLTVKAVGSIEEDAPNFASAQAVENMYDFIEMVDYQDGAKIAGDTGIAPAGTDDFRVLELNTNGLNWLNFRVTARVAGSVTVKLLAFTNP